MNLGNLPKKKKENWTKYLARGNIAQYMWAIDFSAWITLDNFHPCANGEGHEKHLSKPAFLKCIWIFASI